MDMFQSIITTEEQIREKVGYPSLVVQKKSVHKLDKHCRSFIAKSPLLFISSSDGKGRCDVSPRGDAPGSVLILDDHHLVIPERPGNRRLDTLLNILENPHVGLIFLIPGLDETLRVNGKACIVEDEVIMEKMKSHGKSPLMGIGVKIEEAYIHCGKAFIRSGAWHNETYPQQSELPSIPAMIAAHANTVELTEEAVEKGLKESYSQRLY